MGHSPDDQAFFAANPDREYRFRLASQSEIELYERTEGKLPADQFLFASIRSFGAFRLRRWVGAIITGPLDDSEEAAKLAFDWLWAN